MRKTQNNRYRSQLRITLFGVFLTLGSFILTVAWFSHKNPKRENLKMSLPAREQVLLQRILTRKDKLSDEAIEAAFIREGPMGIVWTKRVAHHIYGVIEIFILDHFVRKAASAPLPLLLVIVDESDHVLAVKRICTNALGFISCSYKDDNNITVRTFTNWSAAISVYDINIEDSTNIQQELVSYEEPSPDLNQMRPNQLHRTKSGWLSE